MIIVIVNINTEMVQNKTQVLINIVFSTEFHLYHLVSAAISVRYNISYTETISKWYLKHKLYRFFMHHNQVMTDVLTRIKTQRIHTGNPVDTETHSEILGSLRGEPTGHSDDSTHKGPVMWGFDVLFVVNPNKLWNKQSICRFLVCHGAHVVSLL